MYRKVYKMQLILSHFDDANLLTLELELKSGGKNAAMATAKQFVTK